MLSIILSNCIKRVVGWCILWYQYHTKTPCATNPASSTYRIRDRVKRSGQILLYKVGRDE